MSPLPIQGSDGMRLGIMQPYFLPYLGYFSLIDATDHFVVFDPVQYIRHGWINRNRILKPGLSDPQYLTLPVAKHSQQTLIRNIALSQHVDWKSRIFSQILHYQNKAPYYEQAKQILDECLSLETDNLVALNVHCLQTVCRALEINFEYTIFDDVKAEVKPVTHPGEWALHIASALKATQYINPEGGRELFRPEQFDADGIELRFLSNPLTPYSQRNGSFVPGLSILDVLMFNSLEATRHQIKQYTISLP